MTALLNWRVWAAVMVAIALAASHWKAYKLGESGVTAEWNADKLAQAEQAAALKDAAAATTVSLQTDANNLRKTKNAQIAKLNSDLAVALGRLHDRPARPGEGDLPGPAGAGPTGCTGAGLFRPDAEFLTRKASERDTIAVLLEQCQTQYNDASAALK
jgi:hypothetical protein